MRNHLLPARAAAVKLLFLGLFSLLFLSSAAFSASEKKTWWNPEWTIRKKVTIDTAALGMNPGDAPLTAVVLVRLHEGNFQFGSARDDGSDIRFVAADDKTVLSYHIEKFDGLMNEAYAWVKVPDIKAGASATFWLYYGNAGQNALRVEESKATYDADTVLVYHFQERNAPPKDSTGNANNGETPAMAVDGSLISSGLRLSGKNSVTLPKSASLMWNDGQTLTWTAWIKPAALAANAVIFSRHDGSSAFIVGLNNGIPYVEVSGQRSPDGAPVTAGGWHHVAVVSNGTDIKLFLDGENYSTLTAKVPAFNSQSLLGRDGTPGTPDAADAEPGFAGDLDELQISKVARPQALLKLSSIVQAGGDKAAKVLSVGADEASGKGGENELTKHLSLLSDISKSLTPDGWAVIFLCTLLAIVGGIIAAGKLSYLFKINKATKVFLQQWEELSPNLHVLDHGNEESINSMGGKASPKTQRILRQSPLYHLYQIGSSEVQDRLTSAQDDFNGLSGRSIQAIKATLDGGLVRETQKLNGGLVFLTIGIAGGPYLGLLGTVIGVMITFAVIAKSGQVEVNSIAPGIAGALLATVAGLAVAIPCLFAYSYISTQIKDAIGEMQIFIDEFVAKIAEFYSEAGAEEEETTAGGH